jgi:hypothetical protein
MNLTRVLSALDVELKNELVGKVVIILCGSAVIGLRYGHEIDTNDMDSLCEIGNAVKAASRRVAESPIGTEEGLGSDWLNQTVIAIGIPNILPVGWEDRCYAEGPIFVGKFSDLVVYGLCRLDLVRTKLLCLFDEFGRDISRDIEQLKKMAVSAEEIKNEIGWIKTALETWEPGVHSVDSIRKKISGYFNEERF